MSFDKEAAHKIQDLGKQLGLKQLPSLAILWSMVPNEVKVDPSNNYLLSLP